MHLDILHLIFVYRYWVLLPLVLLEGPLVGLACGVLVSLGYLNPAAAFAILVAGDAGKDVCYYALGRYGRRSQALVARLRSWKKAAEWSRRLNEHWHRHTRRMMLLSKLAYGLSTPGLISAGAADLPFTRFLRHSLPISLLQCAGFMGMGALLGRSWQAAGRFAQLAEVLIPVLAVAIAVCAHLAKRYLRKKAALVW